MSVSSGQSEILLTAGIACVVAAIVGGGIKYKDFEIPTVLSPKRQLLLGGFGVLLMLTAVGFVFGVLSTQGGAFLLLWAVLAVAGLVGAAVREQKYKETFIAHIDRPKELVEDAEAAFWKCNYRWTLKYISQAKASARDADVWESGYAFLLGAQLGLRRKSDATITGTEIVNSVKRATHDRTGHFSSRESLRRLASNLTAIRTELAKDGMTKRFAAPIRAEIDLVLETVNDALNPNPNP